MTSSSSQLNTRGRGLHPADAVEEHAEARHEDAVEAATGRIAPLWTLEHFVAVNPFMGVSELRFEQAATLFARVGGARLTQPRAFYLTALHEGQITTHDVASALRLHPTLTGDVPLRGASDFLARLRTLPASDACVAELLPNIATAATAATRYDWETAVTSHLSDWASTLFDRGQATWRSPWRHLPLYAAWRSEAQYDRSPEFAGLRGFREAVAALPESADALFEHAVGTIGLPNSSLASYFHRLLMSVAGWAGYARYLGWQSDLMGRQDATLRELLAVRLAWECVLLEAGEAELTRTAWHRMRTQYDERDSASDALQAAWFDSVLQTAFEHSRQRILHTRLAEASRAAEPGRPQVQMAFCIDVRSEALRRALEMVAPTCATLGVAGFFGFPIEHQPLGAGHGQAHCPALLRPTHVIPEHSRGRGLGQRRAQRNAVSRAWARLKGGAVSSFAYVETVGLGYAGALLRDAWVQAKQSAAPATAGLRAQEESLVQPDIRPRGSPPQTASTWSPPDRGAMGIAHAERVRLAAAALRGMFLTGPFARLVVLAGHGSHSVNNPHASGLDCGACGGHSGEPNARVAAAVLNDPQVRRDLRSEGITIPDDTLFVAVVHNTTTDDVTVCDRDSLPASHRQDVELFAQSLARATEIARRERALRVPSGDDPTDGDALAAHVRARAVDWSQVRPEWGLARCASFIAAPRAVTRGVDLEGRAFLHSYDWRADTDFAGLASIMTAPMVVASWINLQYYASTVDNRTYGSGNKTLHNVVGAPRGARRCRG